MLLSDIWETCSAEQRHETGRMKHTHAHTEENVTAMDEMLGLLNQKGQKQTYRSTRQRPKETDLTKCSIVQIIHCVFGLKCILFTNKFAFYHLVFPAFLFYQVV